MKNIIFINGYNNYYNRRVKYSQNLNDYINNYDCFIKQGINFNPNDGVKASLTANLDIDIDSESPDYALLLDENNNILSRWFVMDLVRSRNGQYVVSLKRDVIADHFDDLRDLPVFVQKGNLAASNKLIYNKEGINVNQIKTNETPLKDRTGSAWIIGYIGNDAITAEKTITFVPSTEVINLASLPIKLKDPANPSGGGTVSTINYCYAKAGFNIGGYINNLRVNRFSYEPDSGAYAFNYGVSDSHINGESFRRLATQAAPSYNEIGQVFRNTILNLGTAVKLAMETLFEGRGEVVANYSELEEVRQLNGKLVYSDITGRHYRVSIGEITTDYNPIIDEFGPEDLDGYQTPLYGVLNATTTEICNTWPDYCVRQTPNASGKCFQVEYKMNRLRIILNEEITGDEVSLTLKPGHKKLDDAPYSMFAMPFSSINLALANQIALEYKATSDSPGFIYDLQILPYCPAVELLDIDNKIITGALEGTDYCNIIIGGSNSSYLLWAKTSSGTFNIYTSINVDVGDPVELKLSNECDMYRLVSPNYNGAFEFSAAKNLGVRYFEVSYTYKPYSPYIQVNPAFAGLYGKDFDDARGLICNGDFSIATLTDQWKTYEINNKNYENIFNAQIKTMDANQRLSQTSNILSAGVSAIGTGAATGLMTGNVWAGVAAGAASGIAGAADVAINESIYQNNRQLQKDLYNYNLQNIQARPDTLNKVSAYNINNKYFPFIEYYTCSDEEKDALRNKIKYEGMTVMAIGTIDEYIGAAEDFNYFKGQLIQAGAIREDYHIIDAICVELERGIYLPGGIN